MTVLTVIDLRKALPGCEADVWIGPLNAAMAEFGLNNPKRIAMFLAQAGHESVQCHRLEENLNYSAEGLMAVFGKYMRDGRDAASLAHRPRAIASRVYANRMGNGDESSGDGWTYRGRGLLQITGRKAYTLAGEALGMDLITEPARLAEPQAAARSAAWFFTNQMPGIPLADACNIEGCTRRINGGLNGLAQRREFYERACEALGVVA